jgi:hypothetical protein
VPSTRGGRKPRRRCGVPELAVDAGCPDQVISNATGVASGTQSAGIYTQVSFSDLNPWRNLTRGDEWRLGRPVSASGKDQFVEASARRSHSTVTGLSIICRPPWGHDDKARDRGALVGEPGPGLRAMFRSRLRPTRSSCEKWLAVFSPNQKRPILPRKPAISAAMKLDVSDRLRLAAGALNNG